MREIIGEPGTPVLFNFVAQDKEFLIPNFQRFYTWEKSNVHQLLVDLMDARREKTKYFLGNFVVKNSSNRVEIIDGQQRLVSFLILLRSLLQTNSLTKDQDTDFTAVLKNTTFSYGGGPKLTLLEPTKNYFQEFILAGKEIDPPSDQDPIQNIFSAWNECKNFLDGWKSRKIQALGRYLQNHVKILTINVKREESKIYDSINSKGVSLTDADKIKNAIYSVHTGKKEELETIWSKIFLLFNLSPSKLSKFLKTHWSITREKAGNLFYQKVREAVENKEIDPMEYSEEVLEYAKIHTELKKPKLSVKYWGSSRYGKQICTIIKNLRYLQETSGDRLFVSLRLHFDRWFRAKKNRRKKLGKIRDVFRRVEYLIFLHRKLFGKYPQELKNFFNEHARKFCDPKKRRTDVLNDLKKELEVEINQYAEGKKIYDRLNQRARTEDLHLSSKEAIYIFYKILEQKTKSNFMKDKILGDYEDSSLEHIMPKSYEKNWSDMINKGLESWEQFKDRKDSKRKKKYVDYFLNDIGNMSLLVNIDNKKLQNKSFAKKMEVLEEDESDNPLFSSVLSAKQWTHIEISARREEISSVLKEIFLSA